MVKVATKTKKGSIAKKSAGLTASAVISLAVIISVIRHQDPFQILLLSLGSGIVAGFLGYSIGEILDKPQPKKRVAQATKHSAKGRSRKVKASDGDYDALEPVSGEESFLDDLPPVGEPDVAKKAE